MTGARPEFVLDGPDELARLRQFRAGHPDILIGDGGFGTWQALIPEVNGETVVTRYTLRKLLDMLAVIFPDLPDRAALSPRAPCARRPCRPTDDGQQQALGRCECPGRHGRVTVNEGAVTEEVPPFGPATVPRL